MPQRRNSIKALRQNIQRRLHNLKIKTDLKKTVKKYLTFIGQKNMTEAKSQLNVLYKKLDKASKRHILHPNTSARRKAKFSRLLTGLLTETSQPSSHS